jgi:hypothetical protein
MGGCCVLGCVCSQSAPPCVEWPEKAQPPAALFGVAPQKQPTKSNGGLTKLAHVGLPCVCVVMMLSSCSNSCLMGHLPADDGAVVMVAACITVCCAEKQSADFGCVWGCCLCFGACGLRGHSACRIASTGLLHGMDVCHKHPGCAYGCCASSCGSWVLVCVVSCLRGRTRWRPCLFSPTKITKYKMVAWTSLCLLACFVLGFGVLL